MTPWRTMAIAQQLCMRAWISPVRNGRSYHLCVRTPCGSAREASGGYQAVYFWAAMERILSRHPRHYKAKASAQDAHEAIRPSNIDLTPEMVKGDLTGEQYRLYRLIWAAFWPSQMANAVYDSVSVEIEANGHSFEPAPAA